MGLTCVDLFKRQHIKMQIMLIPFFQNPNQKYYFSIMGIINIIYHIYIENEVYTLAYDIFHDYHQEVKFLIKT